MSQRAAPHVGLKNVTINDNFFPGHFPQRPIMPGRTRHPTLPHATPRYTPDHPIAIACLTPRSRSPPLFTATTTVTTTATTTTAQHHHHRHHHHHHRILA